MEEAHCPWCTATEETSVNAQIECSRVDDMWPDGGCNELTRCLGASWCDAMLNWRGKYAKMKQKATVLMLAMWLEQNAKVFEGMSTPNAVLLAHVERVIMEQNMYTQKVYKSSIPRHNPSVNIWCSAPHGILTTYLSKSWTLIMLELRCLGESAPSSTCTWVHVPIILGRVWAPQLFWNLGTSQTWHYFSLVSSRQKLI